MGAGLRALCSAAVPGKGAAEACGGLDVRAFLTRFLSLTRDRFDTHFD